MYVTRPLSHYQKFPKALSESPEGPNSGFLVIQDEESETYLCFGSYKDNILKDLPIPQNKKLVVEEVLSAGYTVYVSNHVVFFFVPVLSLPLSSNRYYAITPHGKHKGEALTCSREKDIKTFCFCRHIEDVKPRPLDPKNIYQQVEIDKKGRFVVKSVSDDGFPSLYLRSSGWSIRTETPRNYRLDEALGINAALRASFPEFNFPPSYKTSEIVVVGKWYTPFMFIRDGALKDQVERSMFYQISLEQRWEQTYTCQNNYNEGKSVHVDATLDTESACVFGNKASWDEKNVIDGMVFFTGFGKDGVEMWLSLYIVVQNFCNTFCQIFNKKFCQEFLPDFQQDVPSIPPINKSFSTFVNGWTPTPNFQLC